MILIVLLSILLKSQAYEISVYGDVFKDAEFFTETFPWIMDNIGGEVTVKYYLLGSGRYTVPQMCALEQIKNNSFLQAQYLKCEAAGNPSDYCLCETGIDSYNFRECVQNEGSLAAMANTKFTEVGIDVTPLVELGPRITVFGVANDLYLKKICTIFGDALPRGCIKPFACNGTVDIYDKKKSLAQFDECCDKSCCTPIIPTTAFPEETTSPYYDNFN